MVGRKVRLTLTVGAEEEEDSDFSFLAGFGSSFVGRAWIFVIGPAESAADSLIGEVRVFNEKARAARWRDMGACSIEITIDEYLQHDETIRRSLQKKVRYKEC